MAAGPVPRARGWYAVARCVATSAVMLFAGFPGFVSKLRLAHDQHGTYRGVYQWDGAVRAERYARSLWRVLELVSRPGSIAYQVFPGVSRDDVLADPAVVDRCPPTGDDAWSRPVAAA